MAKTRYYAIIRKDTEEKDFLDYTTISGNPKLTRHIANVQDSSNPRRAHRFPTQRLAHLEITEFASEPA